MTTSFVMAMGMALWFGILTSISPCPLATNIAAVSYIGRRIDKKRYVLSAGILYMLGRTITYVVLGAILVSSFQAVPAVSNFLQEYMNIILGPVLIGIGLILLDLVKFNTGNLGLFGSAFQGRLDKLGVWGAALLGIVFALSLCPVSAALFFGSLFSLSMQYESAVIMPSLYGIGTALPVLGFAFLIAFSTHLLGNAFNKISIFELWSRRITAVVFIMGGLYFCLKHILHWI